MIDFDAIIASQRLPIDIPSYGVKLFARPLLEVTAMRLLPKILTNRNADGTIEEDEQTEKTYVDVMAASLEYESGELAFNSEKGRAFLMRQPIELKQKMMATVFQANGMDAEATDEKNSATPTVTSA